MTDSDDVRMPEVDEESPYNDSPRMTDSVSMSIMTSNASSNGESCFFTCGEKFQKFAVRA